MSDIEIARAATAQPIGEIARKAGIPDAGFLVFVCGEIMTMPGLPRIPAADKIHIDNEGLIQGLF